MKNILVKKIVPLSALLLAALLFSSCQDVILDNIRKEVALEEGSITGDIRSIVRFKDCYYLANGGIRYKKNDTNYYGAWLNAPAPNGQVIKLAADKNYLYALTGVSAEDQKEGVNIGKSRNLYYSEDGSTWKPVTDFANAGSMDYNKNKPIGLYIFCTNTINEANRSAYLIVNSTKDYGIADMAYKLNGDKISEMELGTVNADTKPISNKTLVSQSCVYCNGEVRFFTSTGSTTNETEFKEPTIYYYGYSSKLRWGGAISNSEGVSCKGGVLSVGVTADYILVGTDSGISHHPLNDSVPGAKTDFTTNAEATLSSAYRVLSILVVRPELNEAQTPIYASQVYTGNGSSNSAQFDHIGLWAYYPSRGNWNRE